MRIRRAPDVPVEEEGPDFAQRLSTHVAQALGREYAKGVCDGFATTLLLLLGEAADGGEPYAGPVPPELDRWARTALGRLAQSDDHVRRALDRVRPGG